MPGNAPVDAVGGTPPWPDKVDELTEGETFEHTDRVAVEDEDGNPVGYEERTRPVDVQQLKRTETEDGEPDGHVVVYTEPIP